MDVGETAESSNGGPGADEVDGYGKVLDRRMAEEEAEYVEGVMPIVREGKRMDDSIEVDDQRHGGHDWDGDEQSRKAVSG